MAATGFPELLEAVNGATRSLRESKDRVPPEVSDLVDRFDSVLQAQSPLNLAVDPYVSTALFAGALRSMKALRHDGVAEQRRDLRLGLEQVRQALRDIVEGWWASEGTPVQEVLANLVETLRVPQPDLARLLGISTRQLQRWLAGNGGLPSGHEEARVRMVAQLVNQLRHVYTAPGVTAWFGHQGPGMDATPLELLADPINFPELLEAARGARRAP